MGFIRDSLLTKGENPEKGDCLLGGMNLQRIQMTHGSEQPDVFIKEQAEGLK